MRPKQKYSVVRLWLADFREAGNLLAPNSKALAGLLKENNQNESVILGQRCQEGPRQRQTATPASSIKLEQPIPRQLPPGFHPSGKAPRAAYRHQRAPGNLETAVIYCQKSLAERYPGGLWL